MSKQSKHIRCTKWETCRQQCASGAKLPFPAYNRIYAPLCFVEQPAKSPAPPLQLAQQRACDVIASFGQYPVCPECGHTDRPVCCIPVEQLAPAPPAPLAMAREILNLRNARDVLYGQICTLRELWLRGCRERDVLKAALQETHNDLDLCQAEVGHARKMLIKRHTQLATIRDQHRQWRRDFRRDNDAEIEALVTERDELRRRWHFTGKLCQQLRRERKQFKIERDELKRAAITLKRQCSAASECTAIECKLAHEHNRNSHANCGAVHYCHYCEDEEVWCAEVTT